MKKKLFFLITFGFLICTSSSWGQGIDFTIKYNTSDNLYEVYGKADFTQNDFFVGGGSQLSIVFPSSIPDETIGINTINGGPWFDNSQVYTPTITPNLDYHGIASNGTMMDWVANEEILLFTFFITEITCVDGIRLFENATDPSSNEPSMFGTDFGNYFVNVLTFENHYRSNYDNEGTACDEPFIEIPPISTPTNIPGQSCGNIIDLNEEEAHTATICQQGTNGNATVSVDNETNELCLNFQPNTDFVGPDSVCVELCDEQDNCVLTIVGINIFENTNCGNQAQPLITGNATVCYGEQIVLTTNDLGINFSYQWTNANGRFLGQAETLSISSENIHAIAPFQITRTQQNCPAVTSVPFDVTIIDFSALQIDNNDSVNCQGESTTLSVSGLPGGTFSWYNTSNNQLVATGANPIFNNLQEDLNLRLSANYLGCTNQNQVLTTTIQVEAKPIISNIPRSITVCRGADVQIMPSIPTTGGEEIRYFWKGPNDFNFKNTTTNDSFPLLLESITPEQSGVYSIDITTPNGCEVDSRSMVINVTDDLVAPQLVAAQEVICGGGTIALTASLQNDTELSFEWYLQNAVDELILLDRTNIPSFIIENATAANSGKYLVRVKGETCVSGFSTIRLIEVLDNASVITATNSTSSNNQACIGDFVQLSVPFFEGASYQWFGPAGFTADIYNPFINPVSAFNAGEYFAVISMNNCPGIVSKMTTVHVRPTAPTPQIIGNDLICAGEDLSLELNNPNDLMTIWYYAPLNKAVDTTFGNQWDINNITDQEAGEYYAIYEVNGCESSPSNRIDVTVLSSDNLIANAGNDTEFCTAESIPLRGTKSSEASGIWTSLTGANIVNSVATTTTADNLIAGDNLFVWTVQNTCGQIAKDTLTIKVRQVGTTIANAGSDISFCEQEEVMLLANTVVNTTGTWTQSTAQANQGVRILNPNAANSNVNGLEVGNSYRFVWTLSAENCPSFSADEILVTIDEKPDELAFIPTSQQEIKACLAEEVTIKASPSLFNLGQWTGPIGSSITNSNAAETTVSNLPIGTATFIWSISNGACRNFSSDTLTVYQSENIAANADQYTINLNDSLTFNVLENDQFKDFEKLRFVITKHPDKGTLREETDGTITYIPQRNYFGVDNFRYKLCDQICESVCDTAMVNLLINGSDGASGICFIPNVMTPDGDGVNDQFLIGCLNEFPEAAVKIFNRWGDVVYEASQYANDWEGNYQGNPVPAGTYYYYLKLTPESPPIQSFFSIFR